MVLSSKLNGELKNSKKTEFQIVGSLVTGANQYIIDIVSMIRRVICIHVAVFFIKLFSLRLIAILNKA